MFSLYFIIPALCIILSSWLAVRAVKGGTSKKKAVVLQMVSVAAVMLACLIMPAKAAETSNETSANTSVSQTSETAAAKANAFGIGLIAAALVTGLSGIGGGIAVASAAPAAIAATSEDPKAFGKALIFVALGEGIALYGLLISIMIFTNLNQLQV
ncbi:MAG: hypothetical protein IKE41_02180 [Clostridia bacterium]|nr:hypothetical protein [Clostridia bacterium]MBR2735363.1 hypothetical protein [Clostridia bacterium]